MMLEYMHYVPNVNVNEKLGQHKYINFAKMKIVVITHSNYYKPITY